MAHSAAGWSVLPPPRRIMCFAERGVDFFTFDSLPSLPPPSLPRKREIAATIRVRVRTRG